MEIMGVGLSRTTTGAAWPSSARVVRCWVKSRNERNPYLYLPTGYAGNYKETAIDKMEEGEDDVRYHGPYGLGYTRVTMVETTSRNGVTRSQSINSIPVRIGLCNSSP